MTEQKIKYNFRKIENESKYLLGEVLIADVQISPGLYKYVLKFIIAIPNKKLLRKNSTDYWYDASLGKCKYIALCVNSDKINILKWLKSNWSKVEVIIKNNDKKFYKKYLKFRDYDRTADTI